MHGYRVWDSLPRKVFLYKVLIMDAGVLTALGEITTNVESVGGILLLAAAAAVAIKWVLGFIF